MIWDGFAGAVLGGVLAAAFALVTTRSAIRAEREARDRDRALAAALGFREFVSAFIAEVNLAASTKLDDATKQRLRSMAYLAIKSAQFARHDDHNFKGWLGWAHEALAAAINRGSLTAVDVKWLGQLADEIEGRLFEGRALKRPEPGS